MLLTPLALALVQLSAAFPVRGSLWRSLDSSFVIDGDTVSVQVEGCNCICPGYQYALRTGTSDTSKLRKITIPGPTQYYQLVSVGSKMVGSSGAMIQCSSPSATITPANHRLYQFRGKTHQWALWADSIAEDMTIPLSRMNGHFKARWRWSRIDSTLPWVRWIDTLYLGALEIAPRMTPTLHSQPVLTMLRSTVLDSIVAEGTSCGSGLFLSSDTLGAREWGFSGSTCDYCYCSGAPVFKPLVPTDPVPAGRTFWPVLAYNSRIQAKWILRHEGKKIDSLWMHGTAAASVSRPESPLRHGASGTHAFEPTTGRRISLDKPLSTGAHLLPGPGGPRLIVVE